MTECFWDGLKGETRPIVLYGTGNGADKILDILAGFGIPVRAVFASDGFVRNRTFRGFQVRSYEEVRAEFGDDMVILLAFGTNRPEVMERIRELDARHTLLIPEVPLFGGDLFDGAYYDRNKERIGEVRSLFREERSAALFDAAVAFRLTGRLSCLSDTETFAASCASLLGGQKIGTAVDGGAFRGDTAEDIRSALAPEKILALEPDPKTFEKLRLYALDHPGTEAVNAALWDGDGEISFLSGGSRGSGTEGAGRRSSPKTVRALTLDSLAPGNRIDFIKLDVEGAELRTLRGGRKVIERDRPNLAVSLYHRTEDLLALTEEVHSYLPGHRLYLRRVPCVPMWDLTLWAVWA